MHISLDVLDAALEQARLRQSLPPRAKRRLLRESAEVSQATLAKALGVDRATISRWESGAREPGGAHLAAYLQALERLAAR